MNRTVETTTFFRNSSELNAARLAGNPARIAEAIDEMEVFAMHCDNPKLAERASRLLAA